MDAILAEHKDQQERVAEEMIALTRSLKEQSAAAGSLIRKDTAKLGQVNKRLHIRAKNRLRILLKLILLWVQKGAYECHLCCTRQILILDLLIEKIVIVLRRLSKWTTTLPSLERRLRGWESLAPGGVAGELVITLMVCIKLCRCWIWLMMGLVVLTFIMMVMTMRLFRKKLPPPSVVYQTPTPTPTVPVSSSIRAEL